MLDLSGEPVYKANTMTEEIQGIHPADLKTIEDKTFAELGLSDSVLKCIEKAGFKHPTPIQSHVIPTALTGKDILGLAQTGSGKTAAFVLPMAERLNHGLGLRGLILCPTREIALQTKDFLDLFGEFHKLKTVCLIGGMSIGKQIQDLKEKPDIVVATPGRLLDHAEKKTVNLSQISELVLDEADHMMDMGFMPQIREVLAMLPKNRHTMMFSATMPEAIERLTKQFLKDPVRVNLQPEGMAAEKVSHRLYIVDHADKSKCLLSLLNEEKGSVLIFIQRKIDSMWIQKSIAEAGHMVDTIHSGRNQNERTQALKDFKDRTTRVLIATDIASRGIDVPGIEHIINYDITDNVEDYIHRAGRTARANAEGTISTIATWMDLPMVKQLEATLGEKIPRFTAEGVKPYIEFVPKTQATSRRRR